MTANYISTIDIKVGDLIHFQQVIEDKSKWYILGNVDNVEDNYVELTGVTYFENDKTDVTNVFNGEMGISKRYMQNVRTLTPIQFEDALTILFIRYKDYILSKVI